MRVFPSVVLAISLVGTASAAFVVDLPVGNGELVTSSLASTETEIYRAFCPRDAVLTVRARAKLHSPRDQQELRVLINGPTLEYVTDGIARNVTLVTQPLAVSGEYRVAVSSKYGSDGDYSLSIGWKQRAAYEQTVAIGPSGRAQVPFAADRGTIARLSVRADGGAAAELVGLAGPDGSSILLTGASRRLTLDEPGDHVLTVQSEPGTSVRVRARLTPPPASRRRLRLDGTAVPDGHALAAVGAAGPTAGTVTAPAGSSIERASVALPAGASKPAVAILLGTGPAIDRWDPFETTAGPVVFVGPNGTLLRRGKRAMVTIPFDPARFPHGTSAIAVLGRSADGNVFQVNGLSVDEATSTVSFPISRLGDDYQVFAPSGVTVTSRIAPGDAGPLSGYGYPLAIDGDWAVVGAPRRKSKQDDVEAGAVYVYRRLGDAWIESQTFVLPFPQPYDLFGASVAISGDTIVVGAPGHDFAAADAGAVFAYVRSGELFAMAKVLSVANPQPYENLGQSVAIDGDTVAAGAPRNGLAGVNTGTAYVFARKDGTWTEDGRIAPAGLRENAGYPYDLAVSGDRVIAGAPFFASSGAAPFAGRAYVWARGAGGWTVDGTLSTPTPQFGDEFGVSVALDGDTALVGARYRSGDDVGPQWGAAYVFVRGSSAWVPEATLVSDDASPRDQFGESVAVDGDLALVGAPFKTGLPGTNVGAAYAFTRTGGTWTQRARLFRSDSAAFDLNGFQVAVSGTTLLMAIYLPTGNGMIQMAEFAP